jgi:hypothetical protein
VEACGGVSFHGYGYVFCPACQPLLLPHTCCVFGILSFCSTIGWLLGRCPLAADPSLAPRLPALFFLFLL